MIKSPTVQFKPEGGGQVDDSLFHILTVDENKNGEPGTDLPQNESIWVMIQIDPRIKITRVATSCGSQREGGTVGPYSFTPSAVQFTEDSPATALQYVPDSGSLSGVWYLNSATTLNGAGAPAFTLAGNVVTVDIENHGKSAVASFNYTATFKSWEIIPPTTDLATQDDKHYIGLTVYYEEI